MTHTITIVGLGNYGIDELPLGIYRFRKETKVYARTLNHPVINTLKKKLNSRVSIVFMKHMTVLKMFMKRLLHH